MKTTITNVVWRINFFSIFFLSFIFLTAACSQDAVLEEVSITHSKSTTSSSSVQLNISSVSATATENDINIPENTLDGNASTRWSGQGDPVNFVIDLGSAQLVDYLKVAYHKGDQRESYFEIWVRESDDVSWEKLSKYTSSGSTTGLELFDLTDNTVRYVRLKCSGTSSGTWNSITQVEVWGEGEEDSELTPSTSPDFEWQNWYLSVPIDRGDGSATSIYYDDIEEDNLTSEEQAYFSKNSDGSYTMFTHYTGYTTSGEYSTGTSGKYCRTELREYWQGNQSTSDNWSMNGTATHILQSTLEVESCGGDYQTYVAQIHGISSDETGTTGSPATVKVRWDDGDLVLEYYTSPDDSDDQWTSASGYVQKPVIATVDNEKFTIKLKVHNGVLQYSVYCSAKGLDTGYTTVYDYDANGYKYDNYFKTGNYFRWNGDDDESATVRLYKVVTEHN